MCPSAGDERCLMVMKESADEAAARERVRAHSGIALEFADHLGNVDYRCDGSDGSPGALEVSRCTESEGRRGAAQWANEQAQVFESVPLNRSWSLAVEGDPVYRGLRERVEAPLTVLESAGHEKVLDLRRLLYDDGVVPDVRAAVVELLQAGVVGCLGESGARERHLFLWLDWESTWSSARPLRGGRADEYEHFGLPTNPPTLPPEVTHLWLVHDPTGRGWYWDSAGWTWIGELGS